MPVLRFTLSKDDYCRFQKALRSGRELRLLRETIEVQLPVDAAGYRRFRQERERRRQLGEPSTMSDMMADFIRSGRMENLVAAHRRKHSR